MAKSKKQREKEELEMAQKEMEAPVKKDALFLFCGLLSLIIATYTLIALLSYIFTWAQDQSAFSDDNFFSTISTVSNGGGKIGLWWANLLISKLFGLGAFIIPLFFFGVALFCLKIKRVKLFRLFFISLFGCILISILFSFVFSFTSVDRMFGTSAGGSYGYYVNTWLKNMFGSVGTAALIIVAIIAWLIIINKSLIKKFGDSISSVGQKVMGKPTDSMESEDEENNELSSESDGEEDNQDDDSWQDGSDGELDDWQKVENEIDAEDDIDNDLGDDFGLHSDGAGAGAGDSDEVVDDLPDDDSPFANVEADIERVRQDDDSEFEVRVGDSSNYNVPNVNHEDEHKDADDSVELVVEDDGDNGNELIGAYSEDQLQSTFDPRLELSHYEAPTLDLLESYRDKWYKVSQEELEKNKNKIVKTLSNYKISITKVSARVGPTVTLYEVVPAPGVRVSQIKRLEEDIQLSLAAIGVRVVTLPGTNAIGIEVANEKSSVVSMLSCLEYLQTKIKEEGSKESKYDLPVAIGKTITNEVFTFDLAKTPHLLIAGATGQGKSVGLNALISSLLYTKHPSELKLVMVDPKKVELSLYSKLEKHFLAKLPSSDEAVITDTKQVVNTLRSLCVEMDSRYALLKDAGVRNIKEYNSRFLKKILSPAKGHRFMPYIVLIIDEYCDLIMTAGKDIEIPMTRLAQLARAIGIHLVVATQRPTTTVITGNIKANFPARIAFKVNSSIDSRTILDESGANQLIGRGDMLYSAGNEPLRVQCALIETEEVERVVDSIAHQAGYGAAFELPEVPDEDSSDSNAKVGETDLSRRDEIFEDAARLIVMSGSGSASFLQRKLEIGYNRASRLIDQLEKAEIIGPADGSKPRKSLVPDLISLDQKLDELNNTFGK